MKPVKSQGINLETFSGRLVAERERLRLTQIDLRARLGVSKASQIRYESGHRRHGLRRKQPRPV